MSTIEVVTRICGYEVHEAANAFPMLGATELQSLAESIKENGQLHSCVRFTGKILDGRNRAKACEILGIAPKFEEAPEGCNPWDYVIAVNAERRDLEPFLKATIRKACLNKSVEWISAQEAKKSLANEARTKAKTKLGNPAFIENGSGPTPTDAAPLQVQQKPEVKTTTKQLAKEFGVSEGTMNRVLELEKKDPEAFEKVRTGEIKGRDAWNEMKAKEPKKEKAASVGLVGALLTETDVEVDGAYSITTDVEPTEPTPKKRHGKAPDLDVSILSQAKDFSYAWELILKREGFSEQWVAVPEAQKQVVIAEVKNLKSQTLQLLRRLEGKET